MANSERGETSRVRDGGAEPPYFAEARRLAGQRTAKVMVDQWGLLTAVSSRARQAPERVAPEICLFRQEHLLGASPLEPHCLVDFGEVSRQHCTVGWKWIAGDVCAALRDHSVSGTYVNLERLEKCGPGVPLRHGDVVTLAAHPSHEDALGFVYREIFASPAASVPLKRARPDQEAMGVHSEREITTLWNRLARAERALENVTKDLVEKDGHLKGGPESAAEQRANALQRELDAKTGELEDLKEKVRERDSIYEQWAESLKKVLKEMEEEFKVLTAGKSEANGAQAGGPPAPNSDGAEGQENEAGPSNSTS